MIKSIAKEFNNISEINIDLAFVACSYTERIDILKYLLDQKFVIHDIQTVLCSFLIKTKWIRSANINPINVLIKIYTYYKDKLEFDEDDFLNTCCYGPVYSVKWLYYVHPIKFINC